jgi:hypothetical protein
VPVLPRRRGPNGKSVASELFYDECLFGLSPEFSGKTPVFKRCKERSGILLGLSPVERNQMNKNTITRKRFFAYLGVGGAVAAMMKFVPAALRKKNAAKNIVVKINPLAVKRGKRGANNA